MKQEVIEEFMSALNGNSTANKIRIMHMNGKLKELPEFDRLFEVPERTDFHPEGNSGAHTLLTLNEVKDADPMVKYAMLVHDLGKVVTFDEQVAKNPEGDKSQMVKHFGHAEKGISYVEKVSDELGVPQEWKEFAVLVCKNHMKAHDLDKMKDSKLFEFNQDVPDKYWDAFMQCCLADSLGRDVPDEQKAQIREEFKAKRSKAQEVRSFMKNYSGDKAAFANDYAKYKKQQYQNKDLQRDI